MQYSFLKIDCDFRAAIVDTEVEYTDVEGPQGGFKKPKIKVLSFGFKWTEAEVPDV